MSSGGQRARCQTSLHLSTPGYYDFVKARVCASSGKVVQRFYIALRMKRGNGMSHVIMLKKSHYVLYEAIREKKMTSFLDIGKWGCQSNTFAILEVTVCSGT